VHDLKRGYFGDIEHVTDVHSASAVRQNREVIYREITERMGARVGARSQKEGNAKNQPS